MGAWSTGAFDNDDAGDFVEDVAGGGFMTLGAAFQSAIDADYLEAPEASMAVAAAAFVAACRNRDLDLVPEPVRPVVLGLGACPPHLVEQARKALARVVDGSELDALWAESDDYDSWLFSVDKLRGALI